MSQHPRTAHPYRDLDVIDARGPRFNQATVGVVSLIAVVSGWWPLLGLLALQLGIGLRYGRRYCLPCVAYFELVQPRFGEGEIEDGRPPRFANIVGAAFCRAPRSRSPRGSRRSEPCWVGWWRPSPCSPLRRVSVSAVRCTSS